MGNNKFRFSDMLPNASSWFHNHKATKTRVSKQTTTTLSPHSYSSSSTPNHYPKTLTHHPRKSYHFTRDLSHSHLNLPINTAALHKRFPIEAPRNSSRRRRRRTNKSTRQLVSSSITAGCSCHTNSALYQASSSELDPMFNELDSEQNQTPKTFDGMVSWSSSCKCRLGNGNHIVTDIGAKTGNEFHHTVPELAPIITNNNHQKVNVQRTLSVKVNVKEDLLNSTKALPFRRISSSSSSQGFKLRTNSPRIGNRQVQGVRKNLASNSWQRQRGIYESFAVVKSSEDPRRDFRESMVEMIVENHIMASKDLEELLACYLALNSDQYHDVIITVFKQIWFDYVHVPLK